MAKNKPTLQTRTLGTFEGRDVLEIAIKVTKAGDGLSSAITVDPVDLALGDEAYVVLRTRVTAVDFKQIKDTEALTRLLTLTTNAGTIVDAGAVKKAIDETQRKIDEAKGVSKIPGMETDPD
jgi:hypothetical protein